MKSLKSLGAVTIGAILVSATYALAVKDQNIRINIDSDDERSIRHTVNGDRGEFILREENETLEASWRGDFELTDDGNGIKSVDRKLEIEIATDDETQRAVFEDDRDGVDIRYFVDDEKQDDGDETDSAVAALVLKFLRSSGVQSDERVEALIETGGTAAVIAELDFLEGDHAFRRYATALSEQAELSKDEIITVAEKLKTIESDHDLRLALKSILENQTLTAEILPALISAAEGVESDHDLRLLVEAFAERPLDADAMELALGLYSRIESDHDLRVAAEALLENNDLSAAQAARLLETAAKAINSDHDMRLVLEETSSMFSKDQTLTDAWLDGLATLSSDHDKRLSIEAAAEEANHPQLAWIGLIEASTNIESERDLRLALESIAENVDFDADIIRAYRQAADGIESERERQLALEVLGDQTDD